MEYNEYLLKLGTKIHYERIKQNLSQEELADMAGLNMRSISLLERGKSDIKFTTLIKISKALNLKMDFLADF